MPVAQKKRGNKAKAQPKLSHHRKPDGIALDQWQRELRKQFAEMKSFTVKNLNGHEVFSDYHVYNPESKNTYKVAIRSAEPGANFCSCMDFKTNALGTCKHIEYVLHQINRKPRLVKILKRGFAPRYTSVYLQYGKERKVRLRIGTENAAEFKKIAIAFFDNEGLLTEKSFSVFEKFLEKAHAAHPDFRCYADALEFILDKREAQKRSETVTRALKKGDRFFSGLVKANLFPYQKQGIEFALRRGRCLLADDMGLGKTLQAIGAAEAMKQLQGISKVLIVCPTSLKYQWKSEIQKFTDSSLRVIEGNMFMRETQYGDEDFYKICSYNVVGRDIEAINKNEFDLVILDEAQRIKNWQAAISRNVKKLKSKHLIVLTGTPVENKLEELYSVSQVVDPFRLGALFRFLHNHQVTEGATGKVVGYKDLDKIGKALREIMLRRHKRDVLTQLPKRMDKNLFVSMTPKQSEYYKEAYDAVASLVNKWMRYKFLNEKDRQMLLINLNRMRMACDSTYVIDQATRHDTKVDELMNILEQVFENGSEKVVIFSQWERMTRIVSWEMDARKIKYENLNGSIPGKDREKLFRNFNTDPECKVFLSTDAGGVGLNLQSASVLVNLDLPWNPAVLEQRIGRIHRLGQKKNVQIINLIAANTIEEQMLAKLKFKSSMATGILDNGESSVFLGEGKFNELMKQVQKMTEQAPQPVADIAEEKAAPEAVAAKSAGEGEKEMPAASVQLFDDDIQKAAVQKSEVAEPADGTQALLQSGAGFLGKLLETLSDKPKTEKLISTLVKTDETTGQAYLQIPVKNAEIVEKGLRLLGQLLGGEKV